MDQLVKRLLRVALVGSPNVGKSTLLNKLICSEISCVSNKVHTTRKNILGVYTEDLAQLEFYDSPGIITKNHLLKHRLQDSLYEDPIKAAHRCDMIVVVVDAGNIREKKRLNRGLISILNDHQDKKSILVLNKVDLVKEKRELLDISTRLSQGCLENRLRFDLRDIKRMTPQQLRELNLQSHVPGMLEAATNRLRNRPKHQYVIELEKPIDERKSSIDSDDSSSSAKKSSNPGEENFDPDLISYKNFSHVFSISALLDEGVDKLRDYLLSEAQPVAQWPHGPSYLSNLNTREIVHSMIRGRVMDEAKHSAPYTIGFNYMRCDFDEMGSLHVNLSLRCPERYMVSMVIGDRGATIGKIIDSARDSISRTLGCEVRLDIQVEHATNVTRSISYAKSRVPDYLTSDPSSPHGNLEEEM